MSDATKTSTPSEHKLRAELEAMVLGGLLGPAGGEGEELTERTVWNHYLLEVLGPSGAANVNAYDWTGLSPGNCFYEAKQSIGLNINEPVSRYVLQRLLKLNHERYAEEVKQVIHGKKGAAKRAAPKKKLTSKRAKQQASLFDEEDDV